MSKTLIYLIAIFALWMYFSFGNFNGSISRGGNFGANGNAGSFGSGSGNGGTARV